MVNDSAGGKTVVLGRSGNAHLRTQARVYCNVRPYGNITVVRCMPCLPYSQDKSQFEVNADAGMIHTETNTSGIHMAYAGRQFLQMVHETGHLGRVAFKPTIAEEDGINAGILSWLLKDTKFEVRRKYAVDYYDGYREYVNRIVALLPEDFKAGMENWGGCIDQHISDTNYGLLLWDIIEKTDVIVLATDLDGDRLTDLLADVSDPLRHFGQLVLDHVNATEPMLRLWRDMGYTTGNGRDMTSVMYRMNGLTIHEQTLGTADAMVLRLLDGDESLGGTKKPYDPRIHFILIRDAYRHANPGNEELRQWLDDVIQKFDEVYGEDRPGFLEGYDRLKEKIKPWCP